MGPFKGFRAYLNWIRSNWELWSGAVTIRARPLKLTVDPTNACQLRCALCPTGLHLHDRGTGRMDRRLLERLLDELGDYLFFMDFFNWGEPLLNPEVEGLVELAARRKILCTMSTNLSLPLTDERLRRLVTCGLDELVVSLDGASEQSYLSYRRQGKFHLVCENMRRVLTEKRRLGRSKPRVTWQFLVFRANEHEIPRAREMAAEMGVDRIVFQPALVETERYPLPEADRDPARWRPVNPLYQIAPPMETARRCAWHYMSAAVNWEGSVAPCCTLYQQRHDFGSLNGVGYMALVNNRNYRAIRERFTGRRETPTALVCETCPTPSIRRLDRDLNRRIVKATLAALLGR